MTPCGYDANTAQLHRENFAKLNLWSLRLACRYSVDKWLCDLVPAERIQKILKRLL